MAVREIRVQGDAVLNKKCKEVKEMTERTAILIEDMLDTMYDAMGVGLAAPQVGILKRACVIDVGEGRVELVNPVIKLENGFMQVPDTPGLGIESLNEELIEKFRKADSDEPWKDTSEWDKEWANDREWS